MNNNLSSVQKAVLENMKVFDQLCKENGLRYFATGGTGLGAVRHKGFIPWDDDADLSMPRADFEKLKKLKMPAGFVLKERPEYLKSLNFINTHKKIKSKLREQADNHDFEFVSVDIFPMDGAPSGKLARTIHIYKWLYYLLLIKFSEIDKVLKRNKLLKKDRRKKEAFLIKVGIILKPVLRLDRKKLEKKFYRHIMKYDYDASEYVACYIGRYLSQNLKMPELSEKQISAIWKIDRLCFGVYLIHPVFIQFVYRMLKINPCSFRLYWMAAMLFFAAFAICSFAASFIMQLIPWLRRNVL